MFNWIFSDRLPYFEISNFVDKLIWITWNRTDIKLYLCKIELLELEVFLHLTVIKQKTILIIDWIVWN